LLATIMAAVLFGAIGAQAQNRMNVQVLAAQTHFHGLGAGGAALAGGVYLATHHGLFAVTPDGIAEQLSPAQDFMGFSPHPSQPRHFFASGHPLIGGNMGVIKSLDGGRTWAKLGDGVDGPVDFHQMDVSAADPNVIYGASRGYLQVSRNGGRIWTITGLLPAGVIDLAASAASADVVFAGTNAGLYRSNDGGATWEQLPDFSQPVTMVQISRSGQIFAFEVGRGLVAASEEVLAWEEIANPFAEEEVILHLSVEEGLMFAVTIDRDGQYLNISHDDGQTWARVE
jgi:photosystem II stability/assembly factor-like uncharacterized protein